jgi:hypothetical protein
VYLVLEPVGRGQQLLQRGHGRGAVHLLHGHQFALDLRAALMQQPQQGAVDHVQRVGAVVLSVHGTTAAAAAAATTAALARGRAKQALPQGRARRAGLAAAGRAARAAPRGQRSRHFRRRRVVRPRDVLVQRRRGPARLQLVGEAGAAATARGDHTPLHLPRHQTTKQQTKKG